MDELSINEPPTDVPPAAQVAAPTPPGSGHGEEESKPDTRHLPPAHPGQDHGATSPPAMSVEKAAEDATSLLGLDHGTLLWTLAYRVIHLEHLQGFHPEDYDKVQTKSVDVGRTLNFHDNELKLSAEAAPTGVPDAATAQIPTPPTERQPRPTEKAAAQMDADMLMVQGIRSGLQAQTPETVEAKLGWLQMAEYHAKLLEEARDLRRAVLASKDAPALAKAMAGRDLRGLLAGLESFSKKQAAIEASIAKGKTAKDQMTETGDGRAIQTLYEAILVLGELPMAQKNLQFKALQTAVAQIPELADGTELPGALKTKAAICLERLRIQKSSMPSMIDQEGNSPIPTWHAVQVIKAINDARLGITKKLKITQDTKTTQDTKISTGEDAHSGPTYP